MERSDLHTQREKAVIAIQELDEKEKKKTKVKELQVRYLQSRRMFRFRKADFLTKRVPAEYGITADDMAVIKSGKPWRRDDFVRAKKTTYVLNKSQQDMIEFGEGTKRR